MSRYYAGVGSRETPPHMLRFITRLAQILSDESYTLRSGHAEGADWAFEQGAGTCSDIFLPWPTFGADRLVLGKCYTDPLPWTEQFARQYHPRWQGMKPSVRKLHMRNVHQVLGRAFNDVRSSFVLCWTRNGSGDGGTGQAIRIANAYSIPVFDLGLESVYSDLFDRSILGPHAVLELLEGATNSEPVAST